jgi:hypothetical protein
MTSLQYKKISLLLSSFLLVLCLTGMKKKPFKNPPGTQYLQKTGVYVDKQLITFEDWSEFLFYTKQRAGIDSMRLYFPDTTKVLQHYGKGFFAQKINKRNQQPIVGVNIEQILAYCRFRTEAVAQHFTPNEKTPVYSPISEATLEKIIQQHPAFLANNLGKTVPELIYEPQSHTVGTIYRGKKSKETKAKEKLQADILFGFRCMAVWEP